MIYKHNDIFLAKMLDLKQRVFIEISNKLGLCMTLKLIYNIAGAG